MKSQTPAPHNETTFRGKGFKERIQLNEANKGGPSPNLTNALRGGNLDTQQDQGYTCTAERRVRTRGKVAVCQPGREASGETGPASTLISDSLLPAPSSCSLHTPQHSAPFPLCSEALRVSLIRPSWPQDRLCAPDSQTHISSFHFGVCT